MACSLLAQDSARSPGSSEEKHLRNIQQLTFGGQNAEAYFSGDGRKLIFQSTHGDVKCDQILTMNIDGSEVRMVSTGKGRTTCTKAHAANVFTANGSAPSASIQASIVSKAKDSPGPSAKQK